MYIIHEEMSQQRAFVRTIYYYTELMLSVQCIILLYMFSVLTVFEFVLLAVGYTFSKITSIGNTLES